MIMTDDGLDIYLKEVSQYPLLTREDEQNLFGRLRRGDESAREQIVRCNLRFVVKLALRYQGQGLSLADLIQEGNMGLLEVVDRFDPAKGFRLSTYAAFWIKQAIQQALNRHSRLIRLPIRKSRMLGKMREASRSFSKREGREPNVEELSSMIDLPIDKVEMLAGYNEPALSLDSSPTDGPALEDLLPQRQITGPRESAMVQEMTDRVQAVMQTLQPREQRILALRYGFPDRKGLSLRNTSKQVGLSQEGVRRAEKRALEKLAHGPTQRLIAGLL